MTHRAVSFFKSDLRLIGYVALLYWMPAGVAILILAEILGVIEELVEV